MWNTDGLGAGTASVRAVHKWLAGVSVLLCCGSRVPMMKWLLIEAVHTAHSLLGSARQK